MLISGADISYGEKILCVVITTYKYPEEQLFEIKKFIVRVSSIFPYRTGLLSLREGPWLIEAYLLLKNRPDFFIINGQGIAHRFEFGLASFIELALMVPTIGCTKEPLIGKYERFKHERGLYGYLWSDRKKIGLAICTKSYSKPIFISSGGKLSLIKIRKIILSTTSNTKFPLPLQKADYLSRQILKYNKLF